MPKFLVISCYDGGKAKTYTTASGNPVLYEYDACAQLATEYEAETPLLAILQDAMVRYDVPLHAACRLIEDLGCELLVIDEDRVPHYGRNIVFPLMTAFFHERLESLEGVLNAANAVLALYNHDSLPGGFHWKLRLSRDLIQDEIDAINKRTEAARITWYKLRQQPPTPAEVAAAAVPGREMRQIDTADSEDIPF